MNPLLPRKYFTPDAEARVMPDGKLYLYGSQDISGHKDYCSKKYHVFVTDDPKMEKWTDCGVSFSNEKGEPSIPWSPDTTLYAPDAIHKDGKYYLYICGANSFEAVAESDCPGGPFGNARPVVGADGTSIDPSVFVDDDGQAYYFWGQFRLMGAKLKEDMATLDLSTLHTEVLIEMEHGFHEGSSIRKRNGKYYMVYTDISRGRATCLSYAVSDAPLGPYKKGGVILDNMFCDPKSWNDHGSIQEFNGQWYVFYHRSSQNSMTSRRVCAEPIYFNADGSINEVEMTSQGASGPINAFETIDASIACRLKGNLYIAPEPGCDRQADGVNEILMNGGGGNWIEDWAEYRYIDFGVGADSWKLRASGKGKISVMVEDFGIVGTLDVDAEGFVELSGALRAGGADACGQSGMAVQTGAAGQSGQKVSGVKAVWLLLDGKDLSVDSFRFA